MEKRENSKQPSPLYRRRRPETTVLYQVLQEHLETFLARAGEDSQTNWPSFVQDELRAFLDCGVLARGFCRFRCPSCGKEELVAFSCKGRGFCSSCGGRRMADTAAYLVDCLLPEEPIRQWVLTLPFRIRYLIAFDKKMCTAVKGIFIRAIMCHLRLKAKRLGVAGGKPGAVNFIQRWGSALNLNPHFHALALDGVYIPSSSGRPKFIPLKAPTDAEVGELLVKVHGRVLNLLLRNGYFQEDSIQAGDPLPFDSLELGKCYAASIRGRIGLGEKRGAYVTREGRVKDTKYIEMTGERCSAYDGFTLHANVSIHGRKRKRLERLCRYMARPAIATRRLELLADGRVRYRLRRAFFDGTWAVVFDPLTFIEKLAALVPAPGHNLVTYHGVFAPNAKLRKQIIPHHGLKAVLGGRKKHCRKTDSDGAPLNEEERRRRYTWAELLKRVFRIDALQCPYCHGKRKLIAMITETAVINKILEWLKLPKNPPTVAGARWPPGGLFDP